MPTKADLQVANLSKRFGETRAVDDVSLTVPPGQFVTLVGPSGCGKTTFLRLVAGLETPDVGTVDIRGVDVTIQPAWQRATATVFQDFALFPHLDVAANIAFGLRYQKVDRANQNWIVEETLALVGLSGFESRLPPQLSGGQQQRVALGRALALKPTVLLLDEPLGSLDTGLRRQLQGELRRIQRASGTTFVATTHDLEEALSWSDQVAVMNKGRIEQYATPEILFEQPVNRFVAEFLGYRTFVDGRQLAGGKPGCVVTIRPERIQVVATDASPHRGEVIERSYTGTTWVLTVEAKTLGEIVVSTSERVAEIGDTIGLVFPAEHLRTVTE